MFSLDNEEEDTLEHYITVSRARDRDAVDKEIEAARMLAAASRKERGRRQIRGIPKTHFEKKNGNYLS